MNDRFGLAETLRLYLSRGTEYCGVAFIVIFPNPAKQLSGYYLDEPTLFVATAVVRWSQPLFLRSTATSKISWPRGLTFGTLLSIDKKTFLMSDDPW